ncbi:molybdate transport system ATP-binding protein [Pontibacter ummariensis]|uniref:Molybdate transport system ATP-binding protein n=1 Tax=Pontibacter ummariensis TaxID=1610492 RepID=A0A239EC67_9BACT|nr:ATP-binding cassette domain-containing protein [Pontibacter ummariensis]PRY13179.1 molybdate transport system ATP-binding protein [Pontibacter ummariensis]SNS42061.1 molybdate transport system ATP-binding protein [Pontibacter ummariensis]
MPATKPFLSLQNITVRHLRQVLFQNLNFQVNKGEHWALVGESGSGKSSLLQAIAGNSLVVNGSIKHFYFQDFAKEQLSKNVPLTHRDFLAHVQQRHNFRNLSSNNTEFYYQQRYHAADAGDAPTVTAYLQAVMPATALEQHWTYEKVVQTLKLAPLLNKELIKLSNGETKRLLIAAALLKNPLLLLLDAPLTGLDIQTREEFNGIIREITASGITVIMATTPTEIPEAITHVAELRQGKIIKAVPKNAYQPKTRESIASPSLDEKELQALLAVHTSPSFDTIVKMDEVSIRYGDKQVLDEVDWHIQQGERWALLGHNGAGKTTLLSLINGDNPQAFAQRLVLFDRKRGSGETIWDIKRNIGFVSPELQQYFPYNSTCLEVVESGFYDTLGLTRKSEPKKAAFALHWMRLFRIEALAQKQFKQASASAQRLCLLARALIKHPPLLILDEPCQGLDQAQQQELKQVLNTICRLSRITLIYVTHYQEELPEAVTRILQLAQGKMVPTLSLSPAL